MLLASKRGTLPATGGRFPRAPSLMGTHGLFRLSIPTPLWRHSVATPLSIGEGAILHHFHRRAIFTLIFYVFTPISMGEGCEHIII